MTDVDDNVIVYKAQLVAKGFRQVQEVDYDETFSPAAMLKSVQIMLAIAAFYDYEIWQMDVKTAFLNEFISFSFKGESPRLIVVYLNLIPDTNDEDSDHEV